MTRKTIDAFGLGQCALDYLGCIGTYPPPDVKYEFRDLTIQGGGPAATAMAALARWGMAAYFAGVVGDDPFGETIARSLTEEGVDTGGIKVRNGFASQFAFIACEPGPGRRTIFWQRPTGSPLRPEEIDLGVLKQSRLFHTDGLLTEAALFAAGQAKEARIPVSVDAGTLRGGMLELAGLADFYITSEPFARSLVGEDNPREACRRLADLGPRVVGVTLGARGYVASVDGRYLEKPAYPVQAVDTTGCGDIFHAGFIWGVLKGFTAAQALDSGAWAAAQVATRMGGRTAIPARAEMEQRVEDNPPVKMRDISFQVE